jgi:L-rhamnose mutarotase
MQRACVLLRVKKHLVEEYRLAHEPVWPEMLRAMREAGIHNYSMFLCKDGLLVGYLESGDVDESLKKLRATEVNRQWQQYMAPYFEGGSGDLQAGSPEWPEQFFYTP